MLKYSRNQFMHSENCIILTFYSLHELDVLFPLSSKQEEELQEIGVVRIYSEEQEYYQQSSPCTTKNGNNNYYVNRGE